MQSSFQRQRYRSVDDQASGSQENDRRHGTTNDTSNKPSPIGRGSTPRREQRPSGAPAEQQLIAG